MFSSNWKPNTPSFKIVIDRNSHYSPHSIWNMKEAEAFSFKESLAVIRQDKIAYYLNKIFQKSFNIFSGYSKGNIMNEDKYLKRFIL